MRLMTVIDIIDQIDEFKDRAASSIFSFIKTRGISSKGLGKKRVKGYGSSPKLFDLDELLEAWKKKPIGTRPGLIGTKSRTYKKNYENDGFEAGKKQPFRAIDCATYLKCLDDAWKKDKLDCKDCLRYEKKEYQYYETA